MELNRTIINKKNIFRVLLCIIGSFILAFGTAAFLIPSNIVAGGTSGIGMILEYFLHPLLGTRVEDIVVWTINIILLVVAYFFVGKKFALHTLVSTIAFPLFLTLMLRTNMITWISDYFKEGSVWWKDMPELVSIRLILSGIFAGLTIGAGVSLTFLGDGSTGGLDVIYFLLNKYLHIKQSISSFVLDAVIIVAYAVSVPNHVISSLIGVVSALISAFVIEFMYIKVNCSVVVDILTTKYLAINKYIIDNLGKTATLLEATGAYSKKKFKLVRVVISRRDLKMVQTQIAYLDSDAFITVSVADKVLGQGFQEI